MPYAIKTEFELSIKILACFHLFLPHVAHHRNVETFSIQFYCMTLCQHTFITPIPRHARWSPGLLHFSHLLISVPSCRRPKLSRVGTTFSAITADRWVTSNLGRPTCPISSLIIKTPTFPAKQRAAGFVKKCILQDE